MKVIRFVFLALTGLFVVNVIVGQQEFKHQKNKTMKKIVIINGHPDSESFNHALQRAYKTGALSAGNEVEEITLSDMNFSAILRFGYRVPTEWEPDLSDAWKKIEQADHLVLIFPIWWGSMPALMKGFFERILLPGFAFKYQENSKFPQKLLKGKTSEIITTMDTPVWYFKWIMGKPGVKVVENSILGFCGVKNKRTTYFPVVKTSDDKQRQKWLSKTEKLGRGL
jgi:putative NADPH-quinone reductase